MCSWIGVAISYTVLGTVEMYVKLALLYLKQCQFPWNLCCLEGNLTIGYGMGKITNSSLSVSNYFNVGYYGSHGDHGNDGVIILTTEFIIVLHF